MSNQQTDYQSLIEQGNKVFEDYLKYDRHVLQPSSIVDLALVENLIQSFDSLDKSIPVITDVTSKENIYLKELKRMCSFYKDTLSEEFTDTITTPEQIIARYQITTKDIERIETWLLENREAILTANKRQYDYYSSIERISINDASVGLRESAERKLLEFIEKLKLLLIPQSTYVDLVALYNNFVISTICGRSCANKIARYVLIDVVTCTKMYKSEILVIPEHAIHTFGHEVLGHAVNYHLTELSDLPLFIKENYFRISTASRESVTDYFESRIFDYLKDNPDTSTALALKEGFDEIHKRYLDTKILSKYWRNIRQLGYWIMCNTTQDDHDTQEKYLSKFTLEPSWPAYFLNRYRNEWNRKTGLLLPNVASEIRYSVDTVNRLLEAKQPNDITKFETAILTGAWSPAGFEEWVTLTGY